MRNHLNAFSKLISSLNGDNVVLAGTCALLQHGLLMSRVPGDLDVVIFRPTTEQKTCLKAISVLAISNPHGTNDYPIERMTQFKFKKDGYILNLLIEDKPTPDGLLYYRHGDLMYKVQSVSLNIEAKNSFRTKDGWRREKDMLDAWDLKQCNFNL